MMEALTVFDAIAIVLVIVSTLMALARGFMRELATLGAFIAAIAASYFAYSNFNETLKAISPDWINSWAITAILFIVVFLTVYVIIAWLGANFSRNIQGLDGISVIDRIAGGIFGFARGVLVLVFTIFLLIFVMDRDQIPEFISESRTFPILEPSAEYMKTQVGEFLDERSQTIELDESVTEE